MEGAVFFLAAIFESGDVIKTSGSNDLSKSRLTNELLAPFSSNLLTRYGNKSL